MHKVKVLNEFLTYTNRFCFSFAFIGIILVISIIADGIDGFLPFTDAPNSIATLSLKDKIIEGVLYAPLFETFLFQYLPILIAQSYKANRQIIIILCGLCFALVHKYGIVYFILAFITGSIFGVAYIISQNRNESAFMNVSIIHAFYNLIAILMNYYGLNFD